MVAILVRPHLRRSLRPRQLLGQRQRVLRHRLRRVRSLDSRQRRGGPRLGHVGIGQRQQVRLAAGNDVARRGLRRPVAVDLARDHRMQAGGQQLGGVSQWRQRKQGSASQLASLSPSSSPLPVSPTSF